MLLTFANVENIVLFGSDLQSRCDFEKRTVPGVVTRCVDEVESRGGFWLLGLCLKICSECLPNILGMDVEGIYRKSGGKGQVDAIQEGLTKSLDHDISDPDLDIHTVTSVLKQYFRKLPNPLITFDVYDSLIDAGRKYSCNCICYVFERVPASCLLVVNHTDPGRCF